MKQEMELLGKKVWIDWDAYKVQQLFMEYREKLGFMVGFNSDQSVLVEANKYIWDHYPQYHQVMSNPYNLPS